jgi:hypothetical protein
MNRIGISLKKGECIVFDDPEDLTKDELAERLSSLFSINNVAILNTEKTSVIIRPTDISSIKIDVVEKEHDFQETEAPTLQAEIKPPPKAKEPAEAIDIIKDAD